MNITCYRQQTVNGFQSIFSASENAVVCPGTESANGYFQCCGKNALCLSYGVCQGLNPPSGSSGYYMSACTDRTFNDHTVCPTFCTDLADAHVVYNESTSLWNCCGLTKNGQVKCNNPTNITSRFPSPQELLSMYSASTASATATATATTVVTSITSSDSSTSTSTPIPTSSTLIGTSKINTGLSSGAKAGIAVGCIVGILLLIGLSLWFWRLQQNKAKKRTTGNTIVESRPVNEYQDVKYPTSTELVSEDHKVELGTERRQHELPA